LLVGAFVGAGVGLLVGAFVGGKVNGAILLLVENSLLLDDGVGAFVGAFVGLGVRPLNLDWRPALNSSSRFSELSELRTSAPRCMRCCMRCCAARRRVPVEKPPLGAGAYVAGEGTGAVPENGLPV